MRRAAFLLLTLAACQKATAPSRTLPEPADLIVTGAVASPQATLEGIGAYIDQVSPGASAMLTPANFNRALGEIVGEPDLGGLDLSKPLYLLLLDPKTHEWPAVLFGTPADAQKLAAAKKVKVTLQGGHALVGEAAAVDLLAPYAFAALPSRTAPKAVTFTCAPGKILARYRDDIAKFRKQFSAMTHSTQVMAKVLDTEIDLFSRLADQTDEGRVSFDIDRSTGALEIVLVPKSGSGFADFVKLQPRSLDESKLKQLPVPADPTMVGMGRYQLGPLRGPMLDLVASVFPGLDRAKVGGLLDLFDGTFAMSSTNGKGGMSVQEAFGVSDGARAAALMQEIMPLRPARTVEVMSMKFTFESKGATSKHGATPINEAVMTFDLASLPDQQREMMKAMYGDALHVFYAGSGKTFAVAMGPDGAEQIGRILDGAGAKPPAPAAAALDTGRDHKAGLVMYMNLLRAMGPLIQSAGPAKSGLAMEMTYGDGAAHIRMTLPAAHFVELAHALGGH